MGKNNGGNASAGSTPSARKPLTGMRYLPATLASSFLIATLFIAPGSVRLGETWFYGLFHSGKGPPPVSRNVLIATADPGGADMDATTLKDLARAIQALRPSALALGFSGLHPAEAGLSGSSAMGDSAATGDTTGSAATGDTTGSGATGASIASTATGAATTGPDPRDELPPGPMVIAHSFGSFRPWTLPDTPAPANPPILSRSLYPFLDGPEPGLALPMGVAMDLSDTAVGRPIRADGPGGLSTGFTGPFKGGTVFSIPAFARLERGVVAALGVEAARRALRVPAGKIGYVEGVGILFDADHVLPIDTRGRVLIRFPDAEGLPRIPASRFLEGKVTAAEVKDRIVFVDPAGEASARIATVAGPRTSTEIHAAAAANLMDGAAITAPSFGDSFAWMAGTIFSGLVALAIFLDFGAFAAFALAFGLAALYPAVAFIAFAKSSWWLPPGLPPAMIAAVYLPFAAARLSRPSLRSRRQPIQPAAGFEPMLMSMAPPGRMPAQTHPVTPLRGMPRIPAGMQPAAASAPALAAQTQRPQAAKERRGADSGTVPLPGGSRASDPRDPSMAPAEPADSRPAPAAHTGSIGDDIERDSKGGLVRVGKYRIVRKMGFGSAGDVFEGLDTHMGRKVAIKTITKNAAANFDRAAERFVLEAKAAGSLNHPCINTIYDFGTIRDVSYMVLEYLDGITLSQWMRTHPVPPRPAEALPWMRQISSALDYAHGQKIIHRDLKPSNLMIVNEGATIKLLDFGIAKMDDIGLTQTGMTVGTPSYMSPEQLNGVRVGPASDQYGLAVVLYQLFTYRLPYIGSKIPELCNRILKNDLIPITDVNPSLGAPFWIAMRKAMAKTPEERYANCMALCQALEGAFPPD